MTAQAQLETLEFNGFLIRDCDYKNEAELREIARLDALIPKDWGMRAQVNIEERMQFFRELEVKGGKIFCAYQGSCLAGFHVLNLKDPKNAGVIALWVNPVFRRRGLAEKMKELGEAWARGRGIETITTHVHATNSKMRKLNEKLGFTEKTVVYEKKL